MNSQKNFSALTFIAIGMCLLLPTFAEWHDNRVYIVRGLKNAKEDDLLIGVELARNDEGEQITKVLFGVALEVLEASKQGFLEANYIVEEVTLDKVPVPGLITIMSNHPKTYSEGLPSLLARTSPQKVAESLPAELLETLTDEAKAQISPKDLAELKKLYENKKNSV